MPAKQSSSKHALSNIDRALLAEALSSLLRERSVAFQFASNVAVAKNRPMPDMGEFKISEILRLSRLLAPDDTHRTLENVSFVVSNLN